MPCVFFAHLWNRKKIHIEHKKVRYHKVYTLFLILSVTDWLVCIRQRNAMHLRIRPHAPWCIKCLAMKLTNEPAKLLLFQKRSFLSPFSIFTATIVSPGLPRRPVAVALATWPNAPLPMIFLIVKLSLVISQDWVGGAKLVYMLTSVCLEVSVTSRDRGQLLITVVWEPDCCGSFVCWQPRSSSGTSFWKGVKKKLLGWEKILFRILGTLETLVLQLKHIFRCNTANASFPNHRPRR